MDFLDIQQWANKQWQNSSLGDMRRNKRAIKLARSLLNKPDASLPQQAESWKDLKAAYRFLNSDAISHYKLQKQHWDNVYKAANLDGQITLFIQDETQLDYSTHRSVEDIGPIGNHKGRGIMVHSTLAVAYDIFEPRILGLAYQNAWVRKNISLNKIEKRSDRFKRQTEADNWKNSLQSIGDPVKNRRWISVGDRGNDIFTFIRYCKNTSWNYVLRASHDRMISIDGQEKNKLFVIMRQLSAQSSKTIYLRGRNGDKARDILLHVSWEKVKVFTPKNGFKKNEREEIEVWCVRCWEHSSDGLEWILLTNMPITNEKDAWEKIDWYKARWLIEEYHKCLKTGCAIEKRQLKSAPALLGLLGILGIIATKLLEIKYLARQHPIDLAKHHIPSIPLQIISTRFELSQENITVQQFWHKVAGLGGFIGRKSDGDPGWQTIWKGWLRLLDMLSIVEMFRNCG